MLRKRLRLEHPSYTELLDEDLATRVNITFHYPYVTTIFTDVLQENWRELKELLRQVRYRRGKAGAAVTLSFLGEKNKLVFKSGVLEEKELSSALDQVGHLTGILGQMLRPETMDKPWNWSRQRTTRSLIGGTSSKGSLRLVGTRAMFSMSQSSAGYACKVERNE